MIKILAFSKYIFYGIGGAEKSMYEILKKKEAEGCEITLVGVDHLTSFEAKSFKIADEYNWKKESMQLKYQFKKFLYLEYVLNRRSVLEKFEKLDTDAELLTYGFYGVVASIGFKGKKQIFLRSESDLGFNENYHTGVKRILKTIYKLMEWPFYKIYINDLHKAYKKSHLVFNSEWMKTQCLSKFGVSGRVEYPMVNTEELKKNYHSSEINIAEHEKGMVFVGDSVLKGMDIFIKISQLMKPLPFYIFSRNVKASHSVDNLHYRPWEKNSSIPYKFAKAVLVPSRWHEAYGRVSVEAQTLGIPVFVSKRGGLPETIVPSKGFIIDDYANPIAWVKEIKEVLNVNEFKPDLSKKKNEFPADSHR